PVNRDRSCGYSRSPAKPGNDQAANVIVTPTAPAIAAAAYRRVYTSQSQSGHRKTFATTSNPTIGPTRRAVSRHLHAAAAPSKSHGLNEPSAVPATRGTVANIAA